MMQCHHRLNPTLKETIDEITVPSNRILIPFTHCWFNPTPFQRKSVMRNIQILNEFKILFLSIPMVASNTTGLPAFRSRFKPSPIICVTTLDLVRCSCNAPHKIRWEGLSIQELSIINIGPVTMFFNAHSITDHH